MRTYTSDVVIVGSGFGGAAPALRLSRAGASVTIIEKGPSLRPTADFRLTQDPQYVTRYLKNVPGDHLDVTCAEALGGASAFYEMVSLRAPSSAFDQVDELGKRIWPESIDRSALDPCYDIAERMLEVEQIPPDEVPRTGLVFSLLMNRLGYSCDRSRYAVRGCVGSGFCVTGCVFGAKRWLLMNYLPQARQAGARIQTDMQAIEIRPLIEPGSYPPDGPLATIPLRHELLCRDRTNGSLVRFQARILILAGGTIGTATLLLQSKSRLPALSDHVGRNIAFNGSVKAAGLLPDDLPEGDMFSGRSQPGVISYEFLDSHGITVFPVKPLPLQLVAGARLRFDGDDREPAHWGQPNVDIMKVARRRMIILDALGLTPPAATLRLVDGKPELSLELTDALRSYHDRTEDLLRSILSRNGCRLLNPTYLDRSGNPREDLHFSTAHQLGSCRMADSKERGVVDAAGEVFGFPGIYVTDGAAIPTSLAVNTSLTILANAERIAAGIVRRHAPHA